MDPLRSSRPWAVPPFGTLFREIPPPQLRGPGRAVRTNGESAAPAMPDVRSCGRSQRYLRKGTFPALAHTGNP